MLDAKYSKTSLLRVREIVRLLYGLVVICLRGTDCRDLLPVARVSLAPLTEPSMVHRFRSVSQVRYDDAWRDLVVHGVRLWLFPSILH